jgi:serpin B
MLNIKIRSKILLTVLVLSVTACTAAAPTLSTDSPAGTTPISTQISQGNNMSPENEVLTSALQRIQTTAEPREQQLLAADLNAFGLDLYQLLAAEPEGNLFFSPYSISLALAMTYAGANAETKEQMAQTLHFTLPDDQIHSSLNNLDQSLYVVPEYIENGEGNFQLNIANAIWGQSGYPFRQEYLDLLAQSYGAGLRIMDFKTAAEPARLEINDWVAQQTEDKIKDLIPQGALTSDTRLVLTNAIYFFGAWLHEFSEDATQPADFYLNSGKTYQTDMMNMEERFSYVKNSDLQMVEIPYFNSRYSMVLLMPLETELDQLTNTLDAVGLQSLLDNLMSGQAILSMPKFKFESSFSVNQALKDLGMVNAFTPGSADFSSMSEPDGDPLYISDVIHKAFVAVDEEGTEAAAATAVIMGIESAMPEEVEPVRLVFDHPFLFLIRDRESGLILFLGRVTEPLQ